MFIDLLLVCYLAHTTCAIINIMTALIFIIVSRLHAFFLVVPVHSSLHVLVAVAVICYFSQGPSHVKDSWPHMDVDTLDDRFHRKVMQMHRRPACWVAQSMKSTNVESSFVSSQKSSLNWDWIVRTRKTRRYCSVVRQYAVSRFNPFAFADPITLIRQVHAYAMYLLKCLLDTKANSSSQDCNHSIACRTELATYLLHVLFKCRMKS